MSPQLLHFRHAALQIHGTLPIPSAAFTNLRGRRCQLISLYLSCPFRISHRSNPQRTPDRNNNNRFTTNSSSPSNCMGTVPADEMNSIAGREERIVPRRDRNNIGLFAFPPATYHNRGNRIHNILPRFKMLSRHHNSFLCIRPELCQHDSRNQLFSWIPRLEG